MNVLTEVLGAIVLLGVLGVGVWFLMNRVKIKGDDHAE